MNRKMKWMAIAVLALLVLAAGAFAAVHMVAKEPADAAVTTDAAVTEEAELYELAGEVMQITEEFFILRDAVHGEVQVNFGDDTLFEGVDMDEFAAGQFAQVIYDGKLTRSLPAQAYALRVGVYPVAGEVKEIGEGSMTIVRAEAGDEVIVYLPEGAPEIAVGMQVTAYTNGAVTMSLPAQTNALGVVIH